MPTAHSGRAGAWRDPPTHEPLGLQWEPKTEDGKLEAGREVDQRHARAAYFQGLILSQTAVKCQ